jgi:hypothetical protein
LPGDSVIPSPTVRADLFFETEDVEKPVRTDVDF